MFKLRAGENLGELRPLFGEGAWPTSIPSGILIIQPQQTQAENWAEAVPFFGGEELGPRLTQCHLGRCLPPYQVAS